MHIFETNKPFSDSRLWQLQRDYYTNAGIKAWRNGDVPHYVTNNPAMAATYAEIIFGFLRDRARIAPHQKENIYLLELGPGSGRLAYHLLTHLHTLCKNAAFEVPPFTYVMSDLSPHNIAFWKGHQKLKPFLDKDWLDFACFDVNASDEINLQISGTRLTKGTLKTPLLIVANYLLDSVPQDLFYITQKKVYDAETALTFTGDYKETMTPADIMPQLQANYHTLITDPTTRYSENALNLLLEYYRLHIDQSWLLFPHIAIRCLERLRSISAGGFLLISADKGSHQLPDLDYNKPPQIIKHGGGFSLNVNFHALVSYFASYGALSFNTRQYHESISVSALLMLEQPENYAETAMAFRNHAERFGPDDAFRLKKHFTQNAYELSLVQMESCLRLLWFDTNMFKELIPGLLMLAENATPKEITNISLLLYQVWNNYYGIGEEGDLAFDIGSIFYQLSRYTDALFFFERSLEVHPPDTAVLYNMAGCYYMLRDDEQALKWIDQTFKLNPEHEGAHRLLKELSEVKS
jgi:tetratricopeptide (TPR) repeat protein